MKKSENTLHVRFDDGQLYKLPAEFLRVYSPSAEVQGHTPAQRQVVSGRRHVGILGLELVGKYAIRIEFDDMHDTGIYSWELLYDFGLRKDHLWATYLGELEELGLSRDP
ncbi:MAG: DUF971 domain-containing protein [Pseudomonadota bacterium]|nr:DUF971 domain-containing protein [Pseudomonadota bacterium]